MNDDVDVSLPQTICEIHFNVWSKPSMSQERGGPVVEQMRQVKRTDAVECWTGRSELELRVNERVRTNAPILMSA